MDLPWLAETSSHTLDVAPPANLQVCGEKMQLLIFFNMKKGKNGETYDNFLLWFTWMETGAINQNIKILEKISNLYLIYLTLSAFGH